jgi:hypothetical protein
VSLDPRPLFADVASPLIDEVLSQYTPPLAEKQFERVRSHMSDAVSDLAVVELDGRLVIDPKVGDPVECCEVRRGGNSPYRVIITFKQEKPL